MSLRAELVRLGARLFLKPGMHPGIPVVERRRRLTSYGALEGWLMKPPADTRTHELKLGGVPALSVARPESEARRKILFLHGGGYITGSATLYRHVLWRFASAARAEVLAIDYRLAPENPFPAALDDAVTAWRALLDRGVEAGRCALLGDSAGGGLALALALRLRDERLSLPGAVAAISPWTDLAITGASTRDDSADPMLRSDCLRPFAEQYLGATDAHHPYASPLYGEPAGLPPTLLQVGSDEILRDDSIRMAQRMRAAGCQVTLEVWSRMPHVWHAFAPAMPEAGRAIERVGEFVRFWTGAAASVPETQRQVPFTTAALEAA